MFTLPRGWQFDQVIRYVSALPAPKVSAYLTTDVRIGWVARRFEMSVSGQNLTGARHVEFAHDPPPSIALSRRVCATIAWSR